MCEYLVYEGALLVPACGGQGALLQLALRLGQVAPAPHSGTRLILVLLNTVLLVFWIRILSMRIRTSEDPNTGLIRIRIQALARDGANI